MYKRITENVCYGFKVEYVKPYKPEIFLNIISFLNGAQMTISHLLTTHS